MSSRRPRPRAGVVFLGPLLLCLLFAHACRRESAPAETLIKDGYDEAAMEAAISTARERVDEFVAALEAGGAEQCAVKAPVTDGANTEHFWLNDVTFADGVFEGMIANEPGMVGPVAFGQRWKVEKEAISDWMFVKGGKVHGNFTLRVLMETMPEEERALWRARLAE